MKLKAGGRLYEQTSKKRAFAKKGYLHNYYTYGFDRGFDFPYSFGVYDRKQANGLFWNGK